MKKEINFENFSIKELIELYGNVREELRIRKVIKTNNIVGEVGAFLAIEYYSNSPDLPKLIATPPSTKNISAISNKGDRYNIKSITSNTTGVFYGVPEPIANEDKAKIEKQFEYLLIVKLDKNLKMNKLIEVDWDIFLKHRKWNTRMKACNISFTNSLIADGRTIYSSLLSNK